MSDHNPLIVRTNISQQIGSRPFCLKTSWLLYYEFKSRIEEIWKRKVNAKSVIDT